MVFRLHFSGVGHQFCLMNRRRAPGQEPRQEARTGAPLGAPRTAAQPLCEPPRGGRDPTTRGAYHESLPREAPVSYHERLHFLWKIPMKVSLRMGGFGKAMTGIHFP